MKGIIYKYTSPSGKSYIGQTINEKIRKYNHKSNANCNHKSCVKFYNAIRKYGFDLFSYEILETIIEEDKSILLGKLNDSEKYYIKMHDSFNNGYNLTSGGTGVVGLENSRCRKVAQYDLDGNFIKIFNSIAEIANTLNIDNSAISACCRLKQRHAYKFQWRYVDNDLEIIYKIDKVKDKNKPKTTYIGKASKKAKVVYQYTLDKIFIKKWDCLMDITRQLGCDSGSISKVCNGKQGYCSAKSKEKFIFSYVEL